MALTPEDVVNKRFNPTKFREGYDQDEVDDFLDEVVVELRRLNQENDELRQRIMAGEARIAELQRAAAAAAQAPIAQAPVAPVAAPVPVPEVAPAVDPAASLDPGNTNNLLQLARRLHEEHVREGMEKRDQLIAEGHATAARIVSEAEQGARGQLGSLQQERAELERRVEELRTFEREYRSKLKGYIEGQLRELESGDGVTAAPTAAPQYAVQPAAPQYDAQPAAPQFEAQPYAAQPVAPTYAPQAPVAYAPAPQEYPVYPQPAEYPGFGTQN